jgi:hypothetical protein
MPRYHSHRDDGLRHEANPFTMPQKMEQVLFSFYLPLIATTQKCLLENWDFLPTQAEESARHRNCVRYNQQSCH